MALIVLAAVIVAAAILLALRARRLAQPLPADVDPAAPLAPGDLLRLRRWERRLRRVFWIIGSVYLALVGASLGGLEAPPDRLALVLTLFGATCLLGAMIQFSERCPRCGYNLGFQSRLLLPESCERCGGRYR